jgi:hypothetical protein
MAYGISNLIQRSLKDTALMEARFFPEYAYGDELEEVAKAYGIPARYGETGSSAYLRVSGEPGTFYDRTRLYFEASGVRFNLSESFSIGYQGYEYVIVNSNATGESMNVEANMITKCVNPPTGHKNCVNEFKAMGGRNEESDVLLKKRISQCFNIHATDTLSRLEQILISINQNVLGLKKLGRTSKGLIKIGVHSQNGGLFSPEELDEFKTQSKRFLCLTDVGLDFPSNVIFENGLWEWVDFDFRIQLSQETNQDELRKEIQMQFSTFFDWTKWSNSDTVRWNDLFFIVKNKDGVQYLPDQFFFPKKDIIIRYPYLPRIRGFVMRDLDGQIIQDRSEILKPLYYQNYIDTDFLSASVSNL